MTPMTTIRTSASTFARLVRRVGKRMCEGTLMITEHGNPADDRRERVVQRILSTIHRNSLLLQGWPGAGKSAILLQLKDRLATINDPDTDLLPRLHRPPRSSGE